MLQTLKPNPAPDAGVGFLSPNELLTYVQRFVQRQYPIIVFVGLLTIALAAVYILTTPPGYTAISKLIIDARKVQLFQQQPIIGDMALNASTIESEAEILRSENIALSVIKDQRLTEVPEFNGLGGGGLLSAILSPITNLFGTSDGPPSQYDLERAAVGKLTSKLNIRRIGLSYVIEISYESLSPDRAASIANAVADAYILDQLNAKYESTRRASVWLQDRIRELRQQAAAAEQAVVEFKAKNNIIEMGGRLTTEQQLAEVNSQIIQGRAATAEARARLDRIEEIIRAEIPNATVADTLRNDVITKLRQQYLDYSAKEADWSARYGQNHLAAVNLRNQMREIRKSIVDELKRIAETYRSDYEIAKVREESMQKSMADVIAQSQTTNQAQLTLRDLESSAQTFRGMHDNFLQKYMESVQQQSFPITESRLIASATPPTKKSSPKTLLVLAIAIVGGGGIGVGLAFLRDISDRAFRSTEQVESALQLRCIAVVPDAKAGPDAKTTATPVMRLPDFKGPRAIPQTSTLGFQVLRAPFSQFAEAIRAIKLATKVGGLAKDAKVIAFTSAVANEGKSTIAANFAQLSAHTGARILVVDGDIRNPTLSRSFAPHAKAGLVEVLAGTAVLSEVVWTDPRTGMIFLPMVKAAPLMHAAEILSSDAAKRLFDRLRGEFDQIIVDLPPLTPIVDVRSTTQIIDSYIFVVEWGRSKIEAVSHALKDADVIYDKMLGVVLNKANPRLMGRYGGYRGSGYSQYGNYYNYRG